MSCTKCNKSHSTVQAFLLACHGCKKKWHHRCHMPPVPDKELVTRIKAHNAGDMANGLEAWKCKYCTEGETTSESSMSRPMPTVSAKLPSDVQPRSISQSSSLRDPSISNIHRFTPSMPSDAARPSSKLASRSLALARSSKSSRVQEVIPIHDSDSDTPPSKPSKPSILGSMPPAALSRSSSNKPTTEKPSRANPRPKAVHPLAQEEEESSESTQSSPLPRQHRPQPELDRSSKSNQSTSSIADRATTVTTSSRPRKKRASENVIESNQKGTSPHQPLSQQEKERKREAYKRQAVENEKRRRFEHKQRQQEFMRAKSEEKEPQLERVTTHVMDLTLETPKTPKQSHIRDTAFLSLESPRTTALNEADTQISPIIISVARTATEKDSQKETGLDLLPQWIHTRKPGRDVWDRAVQKKSCAAPPSQSRRKFQAQKLSDVQPYIYHFNSAQWVDRMKRASR